MKPIRNVKLQPEGYHPPGLTPTDRSKLSGPKRAGYIFQDRAERLLRWESEKFSDAIFFGERWFHYYNVAERRHRHCSPDAHLLIPGDSVFCFEMKLNFTQARTRKLCSLYKPVLEAHYDLPVFCVLVTRALREWRGPVHFSIEAICEALAAGAHEEPFHVMLIP